MRIYALIINHCSDKQLRQFELPSCVHKNTAIIGQFKFTSAINYGHNQKFLGAGQDSWNRDTIINNNKHFMNFNIYVVFSVISFNFQICKLILTKEGNSRNIYISKFEIRIVNGINIQIGCIDGVLN